MPKQIKLDVTPEVLAAVGKGRMTLPLGKQPNLAEVARLPWGSIATLWANDNQFHRVVGPAIAQPGRWALPVVPCYFDLATPLQKYKREAGSVRKSWGLVPGAS